MDSSIVFNKPSKSDFFIRNMMHIGTIRITADMIPTLGFFVSFHAISEARIASIAKPINDTNAASGIKATINGRATNVIMTPNEITAEITVFSTMDEINIQIDISASPRTNNENKAL